MIVPTGVVRQAELAAGVAAVKQELAPDVVRIRYDIGPDWSDEWSIFFRIVLSDDASREDRLAEVTKRATSGLFDELKLAELDLLPCFSFRSQSEQKTLREEAWAQPGVLHFLRLPCARVCRGLRFQTRSVWSKQFFNVLLFFSCRGTSICGTFIL